MTRDIVGGDLELLRLLGLGLLPWDPTLADGPCWLGQPAPSAPTTPRGERETKTTFAKWAHFDEWASRVIVLMTSLSLCLLDLGCGECLSHLPCNRVCGIIAER